MALSGFDRTCMDSAHEEYSTRRQGAWIPEGQRVDSHNFLRNWIHRVLGSLLALGLLLASNAWAQVVFTVNSTADKVDADTSDSLCLTAAGTCTLRAAVMQANRAANAGAIIMLPAGIYTLTLGPVDADGDNNGDLNLTTPAGGNPVITIVGAGAGTTIVDANHIDRALSVASGRTAVISGVTFRNGLVAMSSGGGILNSGDLTLTDCRLSSNSAPAHHAVGGGLYSNGFAWLTRVTIDNNNSDFGGGIFAQTGLLQLSQSTVTANHAYADAGINLSTSFESSIDLTSITGNIASVISGGIGIDGNGPVSLDRSTVSGNHAMTAGGIGISSSSSLRVMRSTISANTSENGGGIDNNGLLDVSNSTISGNSATQNGGGLRNNNGAQSNLYNSTVVFNEADSDFDSDGAGAGIYNDNAGTFNVRNSIIAGNVIQVDQAYEDCFGPLRSYGRNKFSNAANANVINCAVVQVGAGNFSALNSFSELGALQNNGGPTQTHALVPPSNMIDGTDPALACVDPDGNPFTTDQRGYPRIAGARCDIGAFEYGDAIFKNGFD
jgi:CSLREA domain-containing protein